MILESQCTAGTKGEPVTALDLHFGTYNILSGAMVPLTVHIPMSFKTCILLIEFMPKVTNKILVQ